MDWLINHILTILIGLPLMGGCVVFFTTIAWKSHVKWIAFSFSVVEFILSVLMFIRFETDARFQFSEKIGWIDEWGITFSVGVDGISLFLMLLVTFLIPIAILASWKSIKISVKGFMISVLVMESAMVGVFAVTDLFFFYIFWELMLIPMYFLIGVWGSGRRIYSAIKFVLFTMTGSLLMLVGIIYLYTQTAVQLGAPTLSYEALNQLNLSLHTQMYLFLVFALGFAIKIPLVPFHTWLPDAHTEAPTAGSIILAGVLLKMGGYGFIRFCIPLFPEAVPVFCPFIIILSVVGIIYGALMAMVQTDIKRLIAYSSISHLGFVVLGIFALSVRSLSGSILQMVNHGLSTGALFLLVGMLYERRHTREIENFGGLARSIPRYTTVFIIVTLASVGLPGLNGFVGEFLILLGSFASHPVAVVFATIGIVLAAVYLLRMVERVFFGPLDKKDNEDLPDLERQEWAAMIPIILVIVWLGLYPQPVLEKIEPTVNALVERYEQTVENQLTLENLVMESEIVEEKRIE